MGLITSLCQDVDYEVRACMSHELQKIGKDLGFVVILLYFTHVIHCVVTGDAEV